VNNPNLIQHVGECCPSIFDYHLGTLCMGSHTIEWERHLMMHIRNLNVLEILWLKGNDDLHVVIAFEDQGLWKKK